MCFSELSEVTLGIAGGNHSEGVPKELRGAVHDASDKTGHQPAAPDSPL